MTKLRKEWQQWRWAYIGGTLLLTPVCYLAVPGYGWGLAIVGGFYATVCCRLFAEVVK